MNMVMIGFICTNCKVFLFQNLTICIDWNFKSYWSGKAHFGMVTFSTTSAEAISRLVAFNSLEALVSLRSRSPGIKKRQVCHQPCRSESSGKWMDPDSGIQKPLQSFRHLESELFQVQALRLLQVESYQQLQ